MSANGYKNILFDLDGTLTDPAVGITDSVSYALRGMGVIPPPREDLYKFIGPPLLDSFARYYGFDDEDCRRALTLYREYFAQKGIFDNRPYDGITDMLQRLADSSKKLCVATSKPEKYAVRILEHFDMARYFDFIGGASMDETRSKKRDVIQYVLDTCGLAADGTAVMVGDREHDMTGARLCGIDCIGVLYGYGSEAELSSAGAVKIAATVSELTRILL